MASSSSFLSATASSSTSWKYDVFLSFRGEDTRNTFVGHLYSALEQQGIFTYKDDETLPRGESVHPSLMTAIEESQIAVIIFSENYADSSWCLDELAHIMKCRDTRGQIVLPIFYDVNPSEVRKQKRKYGEAMANYELGNRTKVGSWRKALTDASNISGWEMKHIANRNESEGIKKIVAEITEKLQPLRSSENEDLIGMASRMQHLRSKLQIASGGVLMVGIWGVGGGGKTTLATSMYDEICKQFDCGCILKNIREESNRHGLGKLEKELLSDMGVSGVDRLCRKKVLLVLDDVDHLDQLKALAGSYKRFGEGSRIIITTRDVHLLNAHKVNVIHNITLLDDDEAMKLFHKHAPRDDRAVKDYEQLSKEVVSYAGGLPLALEVLGSFLCDKDINMWKSALARLKDIPEADIVEILKISFDGLKAVEKEMFLDIACFYRREYKYEAMEIFHARGFHPVIGVQVLIQKALITITEYEEFDMHDLVQEMAHHIVRGEHPNNPEKHSRIWKVEDVLKICAMDATTELDAIEAIQLRYNPDSPIYDQLQYLPPVAANAKNLRLIDWYGDFKSHLLSNFPQRKLCYLKLTSCLQEQLWEGCKRLPNLKIMKLHLLKNLITTPDFDGLPNLERFTLIRCHSLEEIHPSLGRLERLVELSIEWCDGLKMCPPITQPQQLETLSICVCRKLFKISEIQHQNMDTLEEPCLPRNNMNPCFGFRFFLEGLRKLDLRWCSLGDEEIGSADWDLPNLEQLSLPENKFSRLSFSRMRLPRLKFLEVSDCYSLVELSELPSSIAVVYAYGCELLESFGDISKCKWLWKVSIDKGKNGIGERILDSMLQGNAIEDYFLYVTLNQIPERFVGSLTWGKTYTLRLPDNWYIDFCGFLICLVTKLLDAKINIVMKKEVDEEDSLVELSHGSSNEAVEPESVKGTKTYVGYVSFGSLRDTAFSNSSYTTTSLSLHCTDIYSDEPENCYFGAELVPRRSKGDEVQTTKATTDSSEYWDYKSIGQPTFRIEDDSKSSIKILWHLV